MRLYDAVYIYKSNGSDEELRYSLRSVEKNFPCKRVVICGSRPRGIAPDIQMELAQFGATKWERARYTIERIAKNEDLTEKVWLFNDDFFILEPVERFPAGWHNGSLPKAIRSLEERHNGPTRYSEAMTRTLRFLMERRMPRKNYAVHVPMLLERGKILETIRTFPAGGLFRSLYGNQHALTGPNAPDVKIHSTTEKIPDGATIISTSDRSFRDGEAGRQIRERFTERSKWEK